MVFPLPSRRKFLQINSAAIGAAATAVSPECESDMQAQRQFRPTTGVFAPQKKAPQPVKNAPKVSGDYAICVTYRSGLKATVLKIGSSSDRWNFACRLRGDSTPRATALFNGPWGNRCLFKARSHAIQHLFQSGAEPYPAERTLLTTGAVEAVMRSLEQKGAAIETPHLNIAYQTQDPSAFRETGASWKILTRDVPQPAGFEPRPWPALSEKG